MAFTFPRWMAGPAGTRSRLEQQSFEPDLLLEIKATLGEIRANLVEQAATVQVALQLDARMRAGLLAQQHAVKELMLLAEALAANASAYTSATVSSLYPMLEQRTSRNELLTALDWLIEVDIDRMERMRDFAKGLPQQLVGDRPKLNQILLNTIGNAVKFTDEGEVTVRVESIAVPVSDGVHLVFHVSDTGVGIPAEQQEAVFNAFYQVSDAAHSRPGGTGLGLAICQRLVELMGGRIWLHSVEGKGTTISFELPFGLPCDAAQPLVEEGAEPERPSRPLTVLVVEDDEINRIVCQRYLESLGHHAHATDSGPAALAWLRQHGAPDCVLMDMSLPGESGLDVTQAIREAGGVHWRDVPIVGMSAHVSAQTLDHPAAATLAGFLTKPFQRRELGRALAQAVQGSGGVAPTLETVATPDGTCLDQGYLRRELEDLGRDTLVHLAQLFQGEARSALEALRAAAVSQDGAQAGMIAHKLRSAAGNLGFTGVVETCGRIERAATADSGASLQHLIAQLETSIDRAVRALVQWLDGPPQGEHAPSASI